MPRAAWPPSWRSRYTSDEQEILAIIRKPSYSYASDNRRRHALRLLTEAIAPVPACSISRPGRVTSRSRSPAQLSRNLERFARRPHRIRASQARARRDQVRPRKRVRARVSEPFDAVLMTEIIEHVAHPDDFLAKTAALVKPGSVIVMTTPNGASPQPSAALRRLRSSVCLRERAAQDPTPTGTSFCCTLTRSRRSRAEPGSS